MNTQVTSELRPHVAVINGEIKTTSTDVAKHFEKLHKDVLKAIKSLECSPEFYKRNFAPIQIDIDLGMGRTRKSTAYEITKDGFFFLAMGFTGKQAAQWKEAYITAFNAMAEQLAKPPIGLKRGKKLEALTVTPLELDALVNERVKKVLQGEIELKVDCPKYHYPVTDWQLQNRIGATGWLTFQELMRVEGADRPSSRLFRQLRQDGNDVSGAVAEVNALYLMVESFYFKIDTLRGVFESLDRRGLNIRIN